MTGVENGEDEAFALLAFHARGSEDATSMSLADVLWRARNEIVVVSLGSLWDEIVRGFQQARDQLDRRQHDPATVPLALCYAVAELQSQVLEGVVVGSSIPADDLLAMSWRIGLAWEALLAGDIDDIREHVELESRARSLRPWTQED